MEASLELLLDFKNSANLMPKDPSGSVDLSKLLSSFS